jgi:hypothetical protein
MSSISTPPLRNLKNLCKRCDRRIGCNVEVLSKIYFGKQNPCIAHVAVAVAIIMTEIPNKINIFLKFTC